MATSDRNSGTLILACHSCSPESGNVWAWVRIAIGAFLAMNVMTFSLSVNTSATSPQERLILHSALLAATLAVAAVTGYQLFVNAWRELRERRITIEALFLLGTGGAMAQSLISMARGEGPVYFEVVSILLVVYAMGRRIVARSQDSALSALHSERRERTCEVLGEDGKTRTIPASRLEAGEVFLVRPGERIPADGTIVSGEACLQEAHLTGEAFLNTRKTGDTVLAGTFTVDGALRVRAEGAAGGSEANQLLDEVEQLISHPARMERAADRLARWFAPFIFVAGLATTFGWGTTVNWQTGLMHGLSVLLVACPCAMGFATPLAFWSAIRRLSDIGLDVRGGDTIERLAEVDTVVLDKTGTLTEDAWRIAGYEVLDSQGLADAELRLMIVAAERASNHPLAAAFDSLTGDREESAFRVESLQTIAGTGFRATLSRPGNGRHWELTIGLAERLGFPSENSEQHRRIGVTINGRPSVLVSVAEQVHPSVANALEELRGGGLETIIATGDAAARASLIPADSWHAEMRPAEKTALVRGYASQGKKVLFVGDGLNDASAMAASHVGFAARGSVDLTAGVAGAVLRSHNLTVIPESIRIARQALSVARSNLGFAAAYNTIGIAIAAAGLLHPVTAAVIMTCSSLFVSWRASQLLPQEPIPS